MHCEPEPSYLTTELILFNILFKARKHNSLSFQKQLLKEIQEVYHVIKKKKSLITAFINKSKYKSKMSIPCTLFLFDFHIKYI